tara:strand:+ start:10733 stop:10972 length:240 start_codon:yes stop_codon:yes gene_type:complete
MSTTMFIVGTVIFAVYLYFLIWNIFYSAKKQREENYPGLTGMGDPVDYDGMGNYGRFPSTVPEKRKRTKRNKTKTKNKV